MKKVTYLLVLLLIVFVFFNVFLLLKIHFSENLSNNNNVQISNPSFNEQVEYSEFIKFNIQNINLYSSIGTYPVSLNEIDFKNKLIVYVNEFNCTPCQDYALKTAIDTFTKDNIIILVEYYNKAIEIDPNISNAYTLLANLFVSEASYDKAIELYKKVTEIEPKSANVLTLMGNTYVMKNDLESALVSYKKAVDLDSENDETKLVYLEIADEYIAKKFKKEENSVV